MENFSPSEMNNCTKNSKEATEKLMVTLNSDFCIQIHKVYTVKGC